MSAEGSSGARSIVPLWAFTCHPSLGRGAAHCIKRQARDNLNGDSLRQPFQGCILRRDGGIFGNHHVNARVRPGGSVEHNGALANFHELITGAERTPFTSARLVSAHVYSTYVVNQPDYQTITRRSAVHGGPSYRAAISAQPAPLSTIRSH